MTTAWSNQHPSSGSPFPPRPTLLLRVFAAQDTVMVDVTGGVDLASRDQLVSVATAGGHPSVVIDLAGCTFMDCSGYSALVASRLAIEADGRSLTVTGQAGQPARLFATIADGARS
jgi:anti-anti-sigma factor